MASWTPGPFHLSQKVSHPRLCLKKEDLRAGARESEISFGMPISPLPHGRLRSLACVALPHGTPTSTTTLFSTPTSTPTSSSTNIATSNASTTASLLRCWCNTLQITATRCSLFGRRWTTAPRTGAFRFGAKESATSARITRTSICVQMSLSRADRVHRIRKGVLQCVAVCAPCALGSSIRVFVFCAPMSLSRGNSVPRIRDYSASHSFLRMRK
mmetsp:Transcript_22659/g.36258  ORF Transcript_22659/g.36258 Transcript_22659/m.36258 type:complete len:214 (+) Transcript_22659:105-746(+)